MKNILIKTKNFIIRHNEAVVVAVLATMAIASQQTSIQQMNKFLDEKGLTDEYYQGA